jgi:hypothetical protein
MFVTIVQGFSKNKAGASPMFATRFLLKKVAMKITKLKAIITRMGFNARLLNKPDLRLLLREEDGFI